MSRLNQRGFTLIETMIAIVVMTIFVMMTQSTMVSYLKAKSNSDRAMEARLLTTQIVAELMANSKKYPMFLMNGQQGVYVLCYDDSLSPVPYSTSVQSLMTTTDHLYIDSDLRANCPSAVEVHLTPSFNNNSTVWTVDVGVRNMDDRTRLTLKNTTSVTDANPF